MTAYQLTLPKKIEYIPNDDGIQRKYFTVSSKENILTISMIKMNGSVVIEPDGEYETFDISISDRRVQSGERALEHATKIAYASEREFFCEENKALYDFKKKKKHT